MSISKIIKIVIGLLLLGAGGVFFYKKVYLPKSTYDIYYPTKGNIVVTVFGIGEVSAKDIYPIGTSTGGKILTITKEQGKYVKKGEIIASLDPVDLKQKLSSAQNALNRAKMDVQLSKKELTVQKEQANLSKITYQKDVKLYNVGGISKLTLEKSKTSMLTSQTQIKLAKDKISSTQIRLKEIADDIEGIKKRLGQLTIFSPIDGYVIEKNVEVGQSVPPAFSLIKVVDTKTVWIKTWIDERISGKVHLGQKATIVLRSKEKFPYEGVVTQIATMSDSVTQEREVDVAFKKVPEPFFMNEQAEVTIEVEQFKSLYKVPLRYFVMYNGEKGIWVRKEHKAHFLQLPIKAKSDTFAGIKDGINEQTEIIIPNRDKKPLSEGSHIQ